MCLKTRMNRVNDFHCKSNLQFTAFDEAALHDALLRRLEWGSTSVGENVFLMGLVS